MSLMLPDYPGRGVIAYRDMDGELWWLYFLTGRSDASRSRRLRFTVDHLEAEPTASTARDDLRHY